MLVFADDGKPGITRRRAGRGWTYWDADGQRITDRAEIDRLNSVGLPPAYERAWFCANPQGHIQAIGYDEKGRKQYRYHPDFRARQEADKFDRRSDEHTSELQSLMRTSYAVFCLKTKKKRIKNATTKD